MQLPKGAGLKHIKVNWKKKQQQEEKSTEIERENRILLEKMRKIYKKPVNGKGGINAFNQSTMGSIDSISVT